MFSSPKAQKGIQYVTQYWDQRLYEALFVSTRRTAFGGQFGYNFVENISGANFVLGSKSESLTRNYTSLCNYWVSKREYAEIALNVRLTETIAGSEPITDRVNGSFCFSWRLINGFRRPSLELEIKTTPRRCASVDSLFRYCSLSSKTAFELYWTVDLEHLFEQSAKAIWGCWDEDESESRSNGDYQVLAGRQAFELLDYEFRVVAS